MDQNEEKKSGSAEEKAKPSIVLPEETEEPERKRMKADSVEKATVDLETPSKEVAEKMESVEVASDVSDSSNQSVSSEYLDPEVSCGRSHRVAKRARECPLCEKSSAERGRVQKDWGADVATCDACRTKYMDYVRMWPKQLKPNQIQFLKNVETLKIGYSRNAARKQLVNPHKIVLPSEEDSKYPLLAMVDIEKNIILLQVIELFAGDSGGKIYKAMTEEGKEVVIKINESGSADEKGIVTELHSNGVLPYPIHVTRDGEVLQCFTMKLYPETMKEVLARTKDNNFYYSETDALMYFLSLLQQLCDVHDAKVTHNEPMYEAGKSTDWYNALNWGFGLFVENGSAIKDLFEERSINPQTAPYSIVIECLQDLLKEKKNEEDQK